MLRFVVSIFLCFAVFDLIPSSLALSGEATCSRIVPTRARENEVSIKDFGGVGDGMTVNTEAFRAAIDLIKQLKNGGTKLRIPPGVYLTGSFNLTSHMTLYLDRNAVIRATQDIQNWPLIAPLPSYGRGRELPGARYMSFIQGDGLQDVIISGENGTIDGQGVPWWNMWRNRTLKFTRPHLLEFMNSSNILISNVVFKDSPFWTIHPVYCSNVVVRNTTILAPKKSPNTDGIDADSSSNICIEDCYISTGDDLVAVKSGWDEYGIAYARPSWNITIRRITGSSPFAGIAIGSETSGGVANIFVENLTLLNMGYGIHIKTNIGRGAFIRNITISNIYMENVRIGIKFTGQAGGHADNKFDSKALPIVKDIAIRNASGLKVRQPGSMIGLKNSPFTGICLSNVTLHQGKIQIQRRTRGWKCSYISGVAIGVSPAPCPELTSIYSTGSCAKFISYS